MSKSLNWEIIVSTDEEKSVIQNKLQYFNRTFLGFKPDATPNMPLNYVIKTNNQVVAGINAYVYFLEVLHTDILFVDEKYRNYGLGTSLLHKVEVEAKAIGAKLSHLDTFDFQAKDFYVKHGYEIFAILKNCPSGHKRYYLKKIFNLDYKKNV